MNNIFLETLAAGFDKWDMNISDENMDMMYRFHTMVMEVNQHMNLTTITDDVESAKKHFLDSVNPHIQDSLKSANSVIDIGSGAGFPGIPLAIVNPHVHFSLMDTRKKKCDFMSNSASELGLTNVTVLWGRAEDLGRDKNHRQKYTIATARAVARFNVLAEYTLPFVEIGGRVLLYKLADIDDEIVSAQRSIKTLGGQVESVQKYSTFGESREYAIVNVKKISKTPPNYPRQSGIPTRNPL